MFVESEHCRSVYLHEPKPYQTKPILGPRSLAREKMCCLEKTLWKNFTFSMTGLKIFGKHAGSMFSKYFQNIFKIFSSVLISKIWLYDLKPVEYKSLYHAFTGYILYKYNLNKNGVNLCLFFMLQYSKPSKIWLEDLIYNSTLLFLINPCNYDH